MDLITALAFMAPLLVPVALIVSDYLRDKAERDQ
jgi:hypothetical protein